MIVGCKGDSDDDDGDDETKVVVVGAMVVALTPTESAVSLCEVIEADVVGRNKLDLVVESIDSSDSTDELEFGVVEEDDEGDASEMVCISECRGLAFKV